jgi:hypothetical protein
MLLCLLVNHAISYHIAPITQSFPSRRPILKIKTRFTSEDDWNMYLRWHYTHERYLFSSPTGAYVRHGCLFLFLDESVHPLFSVRHDQII